MAKVSVTVPVYKTEKYLKRCVGSLLCQTLEDIEIILVDDGSPDACPEMCDRLAETDERIKVVHRENGGLGFARNSGIDVSTGEFIGFVDSDDYVSPDMFEKLYNAAKEHDVQIAMSGLCCVGGIMVSKEDDVQYINCFDKTEIFDGTDGINRLMLSVSGALPHEKEDSRYGFSSVKNIYRADIIKGKNIRFLSERDVMSEDVFFLLDFLGNTERAVGIEGAYYYYCRNGESLSKSYRADRFEKCKLLVGEINRRLGARMSESEYRIYTDRLMQAYARAACMQEIQFSHFNCITERELDARLKKICRSEEIQGVLSRYPWYKLPPKQALFAATMKFSMIKLQKMLVRARNGRQ